MSLVFLIRCSGDDSTNAQVPVEDDIVSPSMLSLSITDYDPRLPSATISWTAVADDGSAGSPASAYEIRYSRDPILSEADWDTSCNAAGLPHTPEFPVPGIPGTVESYTISGPHPVDEPDPCRFVPDQDNGTWHFAVRVRDDAGNLSPISDTCTDCTVSTDDITFNTVRIIFSDTFRDNVAAGDEDTRDNLTTMGAIVGDVDGDGYDDFVIGSGASNGICIIYGNSDMSGNWTIDTQSDSTNPFRHSCMMDPSSIFPGAVFVVVGFRIEPLGDLNGDGRPDFGVSGVVDQDGYGTGNLHQGFVLVYLGSNSSIDLSNPNIIIKGINSPAFPSYFSFSDAGCFTGLLNSGKPVHSIAVGEPVVGSARLRIIQGDAGWNSSIHTSIDLDNLSGSENILTIEADDIAYWFMYNCASAGNILPTPGSPSLAADDIIVSYYILGDTDPSVFLIPGRQISGNSTVSLSMTEPAGEKTGEDLTTLRLKQDTTPNANYPTSLLKGTDLNSDGTPDIIVTHYDKSYIYIFDGAALANIYASLSPTDSRIVRPGMGPTLTGMSFYGSNGYIISHSISSNLHNVAVTGNWDGWLFDGLSTPDLIICDGVDTALLVKNHVLPSASIELGLYPYIDAEITNPSGNAVGSWAAADGDIDNNGKPDIVLGTSQGELLIVR